MTQTNFSQMRNSVGRLTPKHTSARELGAVPRVNTSKKMVPLRFWSLRDRAKYVYGLSRLNCGQWTPCHHHQE